MEPARPSTIRVLLVDDHRLLTDSLSRLLDAEPDIEVVGIAASVADIARRSKRPIDVVVMDYLLPDGNGIDGTRIVRERWPSAKVVMLSAVTDEYTVARATTAGAFAYLGKERGGRELLATVRAAHHGRTARGARMPHRRRSRTDLRPGSQAPAAGAERLTPRELQVLRALASGRSTRQICTELAIAPNTVRTHVQNIISKLRVHSKLEAVALAMRDRLV